MARHGVTYEDVLAAINQIIGTGHKPTLEKIRAILGTGSIGTLNNHLRQWRDSQAGIANIANREKLPTELVALVKGLWEKVNSLADDKIRLAEQTFQQELAANVTKHAELQATSTQWEQRANQLEQETAQLTLTITTQDHALQAAGALQAELNNQNTILTTQHESLSQRIHDLQRSLKQAQANLEHFRDSTREQRVLDQHHHDQEKQALLNDKTAFQAENQNLREKCVALEQHSNDSQQHYDMLSSQFTAQTQAYNRLTTEQAVLAHKNAELLGHQEEQEAKLSVLAAENTELKSMQIAIQHNLTRVEQQWQDTKTLLRNGEHHQQLLAQQIVEANREKAQLEGQLQQLQKWIKT